MDDIEQLRSQLVDARASADSLRSLVAERTAERDGLITERDVLRAEAESARGQVAAAVGKYRETVIGSDSALSGVADLIVGDSIEAVEMAAERARGIVNKVREEVEKAAQNRTVPNGGTVRQPPETAGMSAAEKLRYGVAQKIGA